MIDADTLTIERVLRQRRAPGTVMGMGTCRRYREYLVRPDHGTRIMALKDARDALAAALGREVMTMQSGTHVAVRVMR